MRNVIARESNAFVFATASTNGLQDSGLALEGSKDQKQPKSGTSDLPSIESGNLAGAFGFKGEQGEVAEALAHGIKKCKESRKRREKKNLMQTFIVKLSKDEKV